MQLVACTRCGAFACRLWLLMEHAAVTVFMGVVLVTLLGTLLELNSRRTFLAVRGLQAMRWQPTGALPAIVTCFSAALTPGFARRCLERACTGLHPRGGQGPARGACCSMEKQGPCCGSGNSGGGTMDTPSGGCCGAPPQLRAGVSCGAAPSAAASSCAPAACSRAGSSGEGAVTSCCGDSMRQRGAEEGPAGPCCNGGSKQGGAAGGPQEQQQPAAEGPCHATEPRQIAACQKLLDNRNQLAQERRKLALRCDERLQLQGSRDHVDVLHTIRGAAWALPPCPEDHTTADRHK